MGRELSSNAIANSTRGEIPNFKINFDNPRSRNSRVAPKNNRNRTGDDHTWRNANRSNLLVTSVFGCASNNSSRLASSN